MNRRNFVLKSALFSASISAPFSLNAKGMFNSSKLYSNNFGIQLYSVRDSMKKDPKFTLKELASYGYKYIEGYEADLGLFWGMSNTDFKKYLDDLGLKMIASHCKETQDLESFNKKCAQSAEIGMDYLICPGLGRRDLSLETFKNHANTFNKCGAIAKKNGLRFAYHNHEYSFKNRKGIYLQDVLMNNTDPALVDFEMDIYWVVAAGEDPIKWFDKHPDRFTYCHVKDLMKRETKNRRGDMFESCTLGKGSIDFQKILSYGVKKGLHTLIVEQEAYTGSNPMEAAEDNAKYMTNLKV